MCSRKQSHSKLWFPSCCLGKHLFHMAGASHPILWTLSNWKHLKLNISSSTSKWNRFSENFSTISNKLSVLTEKFWAGRRKSKLMHFKLWINHSFRNGFCRATGLMCPSLNFIHTFSSFHPADYSFPWDVCSQTCISKQPHLFQFLLQPLFLSAYSSRMLLL